MKYAIKTPLWLCAALAIMFLASSAFATTVSMEYTGPIGQAPNMGGAYTSPYTALIGPAGQTVATITGVPTQVICDDFVTNVDQNTPPWQAVVTSLGALAGESTASSVVKFDQTATAAQQMTDYTAASYLAFELMNVDQSTAAGQTLAGELSFAIWGLFDPTSSDPNGPFSGQWITGTNLTNAENDLTNAFNWVSTNNANPGNFTALTGATITIYTPTPLSASQEYLNVSTPEAPAPVLLAVDLLGILALVAFFRRRLFQNA
jgi:hypothetical protein